MSDSEDEVSLRDAGACFITFVMSLMAVFSMKVEALWKIVQHVEERHLKNKKKAAFITKQILVTTEDHMLTVK